MRWLAVVVGVACSSACVESNVVQCTDGRVCPVDHVCDDEKHICLREDQIASCEGKAALEECSYVGLDNGICVDGVCSVAGCGNGILEPTEVCDDGNIDSDDGCSFDCSTDETCGNGTLDTRQREACDDGNSLRSDGCSGCQPVSPSWRQVDRAESTAPAPLARELFGIAYDSARGRTVMFGGGKESGPTYTNDTWEWNGTTWALREPAIKPPARLGNALAYDSRRHRVIMFGGVGSDGTALDDTWEWNGVAWKNLSPVTGNPPARSEPGLAYDAARDRVVLFGGSNGGALGDTWEFDGTAWKQVTPAASPPVRTSAAMTYDPVRGRVMLYGGHNFMPPSEFLGDTWQWDGTTWTNVTPTSGNPAPRRRAAMAFDGSIQRVVLHGGTSSTSGLTDTYEWTGTTWTPTSPGPQRYGQAMTYDTARRRLVMFGGRSTTGSDALLPETWERSSGVWANVSPTTARSFSRSMLGMAYDSARGAMVVFGGVAGIDGSYARLGDTWEWRNDAWIKVSPGGGSDPSARDGVALAYDPIAAETILFGGTDASGDRNDTWAWTGTAWNNHTPGGTQPAARSGHSMVYDAAHDRVVMFGGIGGGTVLGDTWTWDGFSWTNVTPAGTNPPPRLNAPLAYDARRGRVVMFGGWQNLYTASLMNDTWEWDGTSWTMIVSSTPPPRVRYGHMLTYDAARGRVVLFGGRTTSTTYASDVWEWDGTTWHPISLEVRPSGRIGGGLAYDLAKQEIMLFGGTTGFATYDTWVLHHGNEHQEEACLYGIDGDGDGLVGCADDDCFGRCSPSCNPALMTCAATGPRCGDGVCQDVENNRLCPADCTGAVMSSCGDGLCELQESVSSCPGDCTP